MKTIMIALLALGLTNCSQSNYKVNKEANTDGRVLDKVPQWYIDAKICLLYTSDAADEP